MRTLLILLGPSLCKVYLVIHHSLLMRRRMFRPKILMLPLILLSDAQEEVTTNCLTGNTTNCPTEHMLFKILEADLLQVAEVMGLESEIDVTEDGGIQFCNYEELL